MPDLVRCEPCLFDNVFLLHLLAQAPKSIVPHWQISQAHEDFGISDIGSLFPAIGGARGRLGILSHCSTSNSAFSNKYCPLLFGSEQNTGMYSAYPTSSNA